MERSVYVIFGEGGIRAIKNFFFFFFAEGFLLVLRSRCHHEGIKCFSKYEGIQELGS